MKKIIILLTLVFSASLANAHSLWINAFESHGHGGYNAMVCLGWGHALPMGRYPQFSQRPHRCGAVRTFGPVPEKSRSA